ncbi:MAG: aminotransferase class IV [Candidatus Eisenbacteria bacterium]|nr:aminotransferase class IV [Candidatus Eisenbacteria bacterium]
MDDAPAVTRDPAAGIIAWVLANPAVGAYEADRTYPGPRILKFDEHLDRLEASARREGLALGSDRSRFRAVLRDLTAQTLDLGGTGEESVRFLVRAPAARPGELEIVLEPFHPRPASSTTVASSARRWRGPVGSALEVKASAWMTVRTAFVLPAGTFEGLLFVSAHDEILEGATSNFTRCSMGPCGPPVRVSLAGIARQIVLEVAPAILPVRLEPVRRAELPRVSEAFLTSSSRAVLPIAEIDGHPIGGRGPSIDRLAAAYDAWVEAHLVPL